MSAARKTTGLTKGNHRYTFRLSPNESSRLRHMGKIEKRHVAAILRECLDEALNRWEGAHPKKDA